MAWIESHQELARHPKTKKLARKLGTSIPAAIGHLHLMWWWAMDYAPQGDLSKYEPDDIADAALYEGSACIYEALIDSGFIDRTDCGKVVLHDWHEYVGKLLERRAADAARKKKRGTNKEERPTSNGNPTEIQRSPHVTVPNRTVPNRTVPNRTVPNRTVPNHTVHNQEQQIRREEQETPSLQPEPNFEEQSTAAAYQESIVDVFTKAFNSLTMGSLIATHIRDLINAGVSEETIKEMLLEAGESSTKPNLRLLQSISERWVKEGITSREESKLRRKKSTATGSGNRGSSRQNPVLPIVQNSPTSRTLTDDEKVEFDKLRAKLGGNTNVNLDELTNIRGAPVPS